MSLLDKTILDKCKETIGEIFFDSDVMTQKLILKHLVNDQEIISSQYLQKEIENNSEIAIESLDVLCKRNIDNIENINENLFKVENKRLKFSAYNNSIRYDYQPKDKARDLIKIDLGSKLPLFN